MLVHLGGSGWRVSFAAFFFGSPARAPSFERLFLRGTISLRQAGRVLMSGGGVRIVMLSAVLGGLTWPLLFGLSVPVFRSSSRVSDSGWRYGALRSRAREQGLPSASETDHDLCPFDVRA
jgi:hypothetical protein